MIDNLYSPEAFKTRMGERASTNFQHYCTSGGFVKCISGSILYWQLPLQFYSGRLKFSRLVERANMLNRTQSANRIRQRLARGDSALDRGNENAKLACKIHRLAELRSKSNFPHSKLLKEISVVLHSK